MPAVAVTSAEDFYTKFELAMAQSGPRLIGAAIIQYMQPLIDLVMQQRRA